MNAEALAEIARRWSELPRRTATGVRNSCVITPGGVMGTEVVVMVALPGGNEAQDTAWDSGTPEVHFLRIIGLGIYQVAGPQAGGSPDLAQTIRL
jgi:hypothetical protein